MATKKLTHGYCENYEGSKMKHENCKFCDASSDIQLNLEVKLANLQAELGNQVGGALIMAEMAANATKAIISLAFQRSCKKDEIIAVSKLLERYLDDKRGVLAKHDSMK